MNNVVFVGMVSLTVVDLFVGFFILTRVMLFPSDKGSLRWAKSFCQTFSIGLGVGGAFFRQTKGPYGVINIFARLFHSHPARVVQLLSDKGSLQRVKFLYQTFSIGPVGGDAYVVGQGVHTRWCFFARRWFNCPCEVLGFTIIIHYSLQASGLFYRGQSYILIDWNMGE